MTSSPWRGSLSPIDNGRVLGLLEDDWDWTLAVEGMPVGSNRMFVECHLARRGREAPEDRTGTRRQHDALSSGARFTGEMAREFVGLSRFYRWRGSVLGPWQMRLTTERWTGEGPVTIYGDPL